MTYNRTPCQLTSNLQSGSRTQRSFGVAKYANVHHALKPREGSLVINQFLKKTYRSIFIVFASGACLSSEERDESRSLLDRKFSLHHADQSISEVRPRLQGRRRLDARNMAGSGFPRTKVLFTLESVVEAGLSR